MEVSETQSETELRVRLVRDWLTFTKEYGDLYRQMASSAPLATVFQTAEWLQPWWQYYGKGKAFAGLVVEGQDGVVGFALLSTPRFSPLRTLRFVGDGGSDYLDLVARPGCEPETAQAVGAFLSQWRGWDWGDLQQVRPGSVAEHLLSTPSGAHAWEGETCPYLPLPPDWEAFRKTLGKKMRSNLGYYERAMGKQHELTIRTASQDTLSQDLNTFFDLHQKRWRGRFLPGAFASQKARAFHSAAAAALLDAGMLRLHTLSLDGIIRAALYCFHKGDRTVYYLGGFDPSPSLAKFSIGTVLTGYAIRYAVEKDGAAEFDFLRGNEGYKYKWGARDRYNRRLSLVRPDPRSHFLQAKGKLALRLENRFKTYMHRAHGGAGHGTSAPNKQETAPDKPNP